MNIPGTVIPAENGKGLAGCGFLTGIFSVTSGLMLSQIREITGLDAPALQNWIKRGWVSSPVGKRYTIDQVARILIINMLRDAFQLEKIAFLMSYINGSVNDRSDDIIPESILYEYICSIIDRCENCGFTNSGNLKKLIVDCTGDYKEVIPGSTERLHKALEIIILSYESAQIKTRAENLLGDIR
jgi:DNA-binding transcriptional MerR regulator